MTTLSRIKATVNDWTRYRRTVAEIERMPLDVALDLEIHRADARKIASRAVYGA